ncbi:MAG TPA: pyridoxamine 5'-phosphate oxidase family protein [Candidatus Saccharimonadales bacterium]|nr:pyridoxamine 5'-phosphate oxidase family protein [Candidatus Saccharimonadales bacterium]
MGSQNDAANKVQEILKHNMYLVVSSVGDDGLPWGSPLFFGFDVDNTLYWRSWTDSVHSKNLRKRPEAFVCMFDSRQEWGKGEGLYLQGRVQEIDDANEAKFALDRIDERSPQRKQVAEFLPPGPRRLYKFVPDKAWINSDKAINGQFVDVRTEVTL